MTGRYEEPEAMRNNGTAAAQPESGHTAPDQPGTADTDSTRAGADASGTAVPANQQSYTEPETRPGYPLPEFPAHPEPSYVDPSDPESSGPLPVSEEQSQYPSGTTGSGGAQPPGAYYAYPNANPTWPGQGPAAGTQSGPYQVPGPYAPGQGGTSGPYPVPDQSQPGAPQQNPYAQYPYQQGQAPSPYASGQYPQAPPQQGQYPQGQYPQGQYPQGQYPQGQGEQAGSATQSHRSIGPADQPFGHDLSSAQLLRHTKRAPQSGWRRTLYLASGKTLNVGEGPADRYRRELIARVNQPLHGCYKIAMLSLKGGVGKTTTTATLGSTFSSLRGDRVIAVDANPDRGTLAQKIPLETTATVRHLLRDAHGIRRYSDIRSYTSQGPSRLEVLASEQDPAVSEAFSEDDYRRTVTLLEHFYNVVLTDCGTGLMHSAMKGVLDLADSLVLVSPGSIDGARSASATLDWLEAHGYGDLVKRSIAVINSVRPGSGKVDVDKLAAHFGARTRGVARIPFDEHLEEGAEIDLELLETPTRVALLELAAMVADDFARASGRTS